MNKVYLAVDFETANEKRISACAVGLAWIQNGEIIRSKKHLIKPPVGERFKKINERIHGISSQHVKDALDFKELWEKNLNTLFHEHELVLHNSSMDAAVIKACLKHYEIADYNIKYYDTMKMAAKRGLPLKLVDLADVHGVEYESEHDPEKDATACGLVFHKIISSSEVSEDEVNVISFEKENAPKKLDKWNTTEVANNNISTITKYGVKNTSEISIEGKVFVLTGELEEERRFYKDLLIQNKGLVRSGITGNTDFVVIGEKFGPSKITQIENLNSSKGKNIRIISPLVFYELVESLKID